LKSHYPSIPKQAATMSQKNEPEKMTTEAVSCKKPCNVGDADDFARWLLPRGFVMRRRLPSKLLYAQDPQHPARCSEPADELLAP
jgi:hypothetical protein